MIKNGKEGVYMKRVMFTTIGFIILTMTLFPMVLADQETIEEEFYPPLAHISWEREEVGDTLFFSLSASDSLDPDNLITSYEWVYMKNGSVIVEYSGPYMIFEIKEDGIYNVTLTIRTDEGYSDTVLMDIDYEPSDDDKIIMGISVTGHLEVYESLRIEKEANDEMKWYGFSIITVIIITALILIITMEMIIIFLKRKRNIERNEG